MNIFYLQYEAYGDQFCGLTVTGLCTITFDFSVYSCYFELGEQTNTKLKVYLKFCFAAGHVVSATMLIFLNFLLATNFITID